MFSTGLQVPNARIHTYICTHTYTTKIQVTAGASGGFHFVTVFAYINFRYTQQHSDNYDNNNNNARS